MRRKRPHVASPDEVRITRNETEVIVEYADERVGPTHIRLDAELRRMSDQEILEFWNEGVRAREQLAAEYDHVAVEIPPGKPQLAYFEPGCQWTPRGDVLRCVIDSGSLDDLPIIHIDDHALSWHELGQMLTTHEGWGMRIVFVPDDELYPAPCIEVREPEDKGER